MFQKLVARLRTLCEPSTTLRGSRSSPWGVRSLTGVRTGSRWQRGLPTPGPCVTTGRGGRAHECPVNVRFPECCHFNNIRWILIFVVAYWKNERLLKFIKWKASLILHFSGNFKYQQNSKVYKIFENWCSRILMTPPFIKLCIKLKCLDLAVVLHAVALVQNILLYTYCTWYIKVMFGVNDAYVKLRFHYHD